MGFRVWGFGFGGLGFGVWGFGFGVVGSRVCAILYGLGLGFWG